MASIAQDAPVGANPRSAQGPVGGDETQALCSGARCQPLPSPTPVSDEPDTFDETDNGPVAAIYKKYDLDTYFNRQYAQHCKEDTAPTPSLLNHPVMLTC